MIPRSSSAPPTVLAGLTALLLGGATVEAEAQTAPAPPVAGQRLGELPLAPMSGAPLGGLGNRRLGGPGRQRIDDRPRPAATPTPSATRAAPSTFRAIADAIDRASDPS